MGSLLVDDGILDGIRDILFSQQDQDPVEEEGEAKTYQLQCCLLRPHTPTTHASRQSQFRESIVRIASSENQRDRG